MAYCSQCGAEITTDANVCPSCGATIGAPTAITPVVNDWDHTSEFDAKDIADNKVYAMAAYALDFLGIFFALLVIRDSEYVKFHARECMKITIAEIVVAVLTCLLCWTCIVPIAGFVILFILTILKVIAFVQVCKNEAKEPWMIRSIKWLQ